MRKYVKPMMEGQMFASNEYVAACGDSNTVYKFTCDAGYVDEEHTSGFCGCDEFHFYAPSGTYKAKGHWTVYDSNNNKLTRTYYYPCGTTHEAPANNIFLNGYMDNQDTSVEEKVPVVIWRGTDGNNVHCTTNLDMNTWETAKS